MNKDISRDILTQNVVHALVEHGCRTGIIKIEFFRDAYKYHQAATVDIQGKRFDIMFRKEEAPATEIYHTLVKMEDTELRNLCLEDLCKNFIQALWV